jgi:hypothetical protein
MRKGERAMLKAKKRPLPTEYQSRVLRRLLQSGGSLVLTHQEGCNDRYHDQAGVTVPEKTAQMLIRHGWVEAQRDSMFNLTPQSWRVKSVPQ